MEQNKNSKESKIYTCPMHPDVKQGGPGFCPECGMNLIPETGKNGAREETEKHKGHSPEMFYRKFWVSLILTIPVVLYSELPETLLKLKAPVFPGSQYLPLILGSIVFFYGGWVFLAGAWRELKVKMPGMMTLVALAILAAYLFSIFDFLGGGQHALFWELTSLITVMLLGHWLEMRAVQGAQGALKELAKLLPDTAEVLKGDKTEIIPLGKLREGDVVLVKPGGKIPADGQILEGRSSVNESFVTGESKPVEKNPGNEVIAGTINGDGSLKVSIRKIGERTFLAGVMKLVAQAQASKSKLQILSDRAAFYLTLIAIVAGIITFAAWLLVRAGIVFATERLVAVLVIACPHALGLAVPLVASISTTLAARNGLLVRQRISLELARNINTVLFDKTGTLTRGEYGVDTIIPSSNMSAAQILQLAASVNSGSEHPIAKALTGEAEKQGLNLFETKNFQRIPGKGAKAEIKGSEVLVGSETLMKETGAKPEEEIRAKTEIFAKQGKTIIYVISENQFVGVIALADKIREESSGAVKALNDMGLKVVMITGDSEDVAGWVAGELKIDEYFAQVLPGQKADKVKLLQSKGLKVAMVGDGVNDAPALIQADLGIAIGAGTNIAIESAGIILVKNDPRDIVKIIRLSRITYSKMIQNLIWATGYNIIALPLAAGVLAFKGILFQPALAAVFMSLSTIIVAFNALLLRRQKI